MKNTQIENKEEIIECTKEMLENLATAGINMRLFLIKPDILSPIPRGISLPNNKDRIIRVMATKHYEPFDSNKWGPPITSHYPLFIDIAPRSDKQHLNFFYHISNIKPILGGNMGLVVSSGADEDRAVITLSTGVTYNLLYRSSSMQNYERTKWNNNGKDFHLEDIFVAY